MPEPTPSPRPPAYHAPVMVAEVLSYLAVRSSGIYLDATLGGGGHARAVLELLGPDGHLIGIDQDAEAIAEAERWAEPYGARFTTVQANFADLAGALDAAGIDEVDGALFDLGVSSHQLDEPSRGFSFRSGGPLDMRMDAGSGEPVSELLAGWSERELAEVIREFGEERFAGRIARVILAERERLDDTAQLAEVIRKVVPRGADADRIHPATRTFQALRIATNREMDVLPEGLTQAVSALRPGGRIVVIAYHSLEDRIVKNLFRDEARGCICPPRMPRCGCGRTPTLEVLTTKPVRPSDQETDVNPRARSARLRAARKLANSPKKDV